MRFVIRILSMTHVVGGDQPWGLQSSTVSRDANLTRTAPDRSVVLPAPGADIIDA